MSKDGKLKLSGDKLAKIALGTIFGISSLICGVVTRNQSNDKLTKIAKKVRNRYYSSIFLISL